MKRSIFLLIIVILYNSGYSQSKKDQIFDPETVKMILLSINTEKSDFGPALIGDSLYYTSSNKISKNDGNKDEFYDLFVSQINEKGNISGKRKVIKQFANNYHNGPVSWCPATKELFITQSNYLQFKTKFNPFRKNYHNLQIIIAKQINGSWETAEKFIYNNPMYSVGHPAISANGDTLIFSSNKPGGLGETDLYISILKNEKWSPPVNLGPKINSAGKDEFPFLSNHGDLIFASNGRDGFGNLDLYYTKLNDPKSTIYHFDHPINSEFDDFSMMIMREKNYGYFSSNRPGYGDDDLYQFTFSGFKENFLQLTVLDSKSHQTLSQAEISFNDSVELKTNENGQITKKITEDLSLNIGVKALGYFSGTKTIKTGVLKSGEVIRDTILLQMLEKEKYVIRNLYFDYKRWDLLTESKKELDHLVYYLINNSETKVNLGAHADARGTKEYNEKLSELRMKKVVDYLIKKGIDADRIDSKSYGESIPVNNCVNLKNCTPQELRMNRRVEFFISELGKSEMVDQGDKGDYTETVTDGKKSIKNPLNHAVIVGSFKIKSNAEKIFRQLRKNGFKAEILDYNDLFIVKVGFHNSKSAKEEFKKLKSKYGGAVLM